MAAEKPLNPNKMDGNAAMPPETFKALIVRELSDSTFTREIGRKRLSELPAGDVLIRVKFSSLNYKDALSATGNRGVTRRYPHTPGVDAAGVVESSADPAFQPGDPVIVTGYDLGMDTSGGFGQYIRVPAGWVVPLPDGLTLRESMIYGTAGFTAALSVDKLVTHGLRPDSGEVLVTGATGGVGGVAVGILARIGFAVYGVSGKAEAQAYLRELGARGVVSRAEFDDRSGRPLLHGRWAGIVDTVGGSVLASALKSTRPHAPVTACGNVGGGEFTASVYPFILRGITLYGIDSAQTPMIHRRRMWDKLAGEWKPERLAEMAQECRLEDLEPEISRILKGERKGRLVVRLD